MFAVDIARVKGFEDKNAIVSFFLEQPHLDLNLTHSYIFGDENVVEMALEHLSPLFEAHKHLVRMKGGIWSMSPHRSFELIERIDSNNEDFVLKVL